MTATGSPLPEISTLAAALADRYAVEKELGRGGMATVYLARDIKHGRAVAIKVLNPELGAVIGSERFLAEIRVTANLQHPHLLSLFDSGEAAGLLYYVMPFVEGESLRARLDRERQLPVDDAVRIATAIGGALQYAHALGVIHRDLKPENILLQHGQPVIADFGIALAVSKAGGQRVTQTGLSLGTPQYMSPEQATGDRVIDGRSDIYSLGAMLYEMLVGDPPHAANTAQATIARVLTEEARPVRTMRPSVPEHVETAVQIALEKFAADRFPTAAEFCEALSGRGATSVRMRSGNPHILTGANRRLLQVAPWLVAAVAITVAGWARFRDIPAPRSLAVFDLTYPESFVPAIGGQEAYAVSADGSMVIFAGASTANPGNATLFLRRIGERAASRIPGTEQARWPFFANGDRDLYFVQQSKLYRVPLDGGQPVLVRDSVTHASIGDRGSLLFEHGALLWRIPAGERDAVPVPIDDEMGPRIFAARFAEFLPGERYILTAIRKVADAPSELALIDVQSGVATPLGLQGAHPRYSLTGHLVFVRVDGALLSVPFSLRTRKSSGQPTPIVTGMLTGSNGSGGYAISSAGTLVAATGASRDWRALEVVSSNGSITHVAAEPRLYGWPVISPDGRRVALEIAEKPAGPWDVWVFDFESRTLSRTTTGGSGYRPGGWMPDGRRVVYLDGSIARILKVYTRQWDGSGVPQLLMEHAQSIQSVHVGPAGSWIAASVGTFATRDIVVAPLDSPTAVRPFVTGPANEASPRVSPDGRMLAYTSDESGRTEVYVRPLDTHGTRLQVSVDGGTEPQWNPRTGALHYRTAVATVRAVLTRDTDVRVARRDSLFALGRLFVSPGAPHYDVFPDGQRFVAISGGGENVRTVVYLGWPELAR